MGVLMVLTCFGHLMRLNASKESIQEEILCSFPTGDGRLSFQDFVACSG